MPPKNLRAAAVLAWSAWIAWGGVFPGRAQGQSEDGIGAEADLSPIRAISLPPVRATSSRPLSAVARRSVLRAIAGNPKLQISVETPADGAVFGDASGTAFIAGKGLSRFGELSAFDILFVVDQSDSTGVPAGSDVNGDGRIERGSCKGVPPLLGPFARIRGNCEAADDSILAAELAAVRTLIRQLDPQRTRVGVVTFSGDGPGGRDDASVAAALTSDYAAVELSLEAIRKRGPNGRTNIEAGIQLAAQELRRARGGYSPLGKAPEQVILFMSDGVPTLPSEQSIRENRQLAVSAALIAARADIRIDTFGVGSEALSSPETLVEMAGVTSGLFTPIDRPGDLVPVFEQINLAGIETVRVSNRTSRSEAQYTLLNADGSFSALVDMVPGTNTIEIYARATDGSEATRKLAVNFSRTAVAEVLPERLLEQRNRLLGSRLNSLRERSSAITAQRDEDVRKALVERIRQTRKRIEDRTRAVQIEADREP